MVNEDFTQQRTPVGRLFLIAMPEMVIAEDLRGAILEREPGATVVIEASMAEADRALDASGLEVRGAFLDVAPEDYAASRIAAVMAAAGLRAVLLGDAAEAAGPNAGYHVLERPFSTEDVHKIMQQPLAA